MQNYFNKFYEKFWDVINNNKYLKLAIFLAVLYKSSSYLNQIFKTSRLLIGPTNYRKILQ